MQHPGKYVQSKFNFSGGIVSSVGYNCVFCNTSTDAFWLFNVQSSNEWFL